tara:strand:+ start:493 stop:1794 length:1302 start_codon:yes stop_codon:yes gene_type:complete
MKGSTTGRAADGSGPATPTAVPSNEALFAELDAALTCDDYGRARLARTQRGGDDGDDGSNVVFLENGDVHVCRGAHCPFLELNADKHYACKYTGIVVGAQTLRDDYSTGRSGGSANPDDYCGEPVGGSWRPKRDQMGLSHLAYQAAESAELKAQETELYVATTPPKKAPRNGAKRGARCVDDCATPEAPPETKRPRQARRSADTREAFDALRVDAEVTMNKLLNFEKRTEAKKPPIEVGSLDAGLLFEAAVKKYRKECIATNQQPTLDAVHNLSLQATRVAAEHRRKKAVEEGRSALLLKARTRHSVSSLAVTLWLASCATPYMEESSKRGADSFRPFVSGVLYALKRGVTLQDGTVVLPRLPELTDALPVLRATAANSQAKAIHASSHRGLCTLHRSIASCPNALATKLYASAAWMANQLTEDVRAKRFDIC